MSIAEFTRRKMFEKWWDSTHADGLKTRGNRTGLGYDRFAPNRSWLDFNAGCDAQLEMMNLTPIEDVTA